MEVYRACHRFPLGFIEVAGVEHGILSITFIDQKLVQPEKLHSQLSSCLQQLDEYFRGVRIRFELKLLPRGTEFQRIVWKHLMRIPHGETVSYGEIARTLGRIKAARAVGGAVGKNPLAIVIPCHRVVGARGDLTGYGGGLWRKEQLLAHEKKVKEHLIGATS